MKTWQQRGKFGTFMLACRISYRLVMSPAVYPRHSTSFRLVYFNPLMIPLVILNFVNFGIRASLLHPDVLSAHCRCRGCSLLCAIRFERCHRAELLCRCRGLYMSPLCGQANGPQYCNASQLLAWDCLVCENSWARGMNVTSIITNTTSFALSCCSDAFGNLRSDTHAYIGVSATKKIVLAFRGTHDLHEFITDLDFVKVRSLSDLSGT